MRRTVFLPMLAWSIPAGILGQFSLAGMSLFYDSSLWVAHAVLGFSLVLPIGIVSTLAFLRPTGGRRLWAALLLVAYGLQIALAIAADAASSALAQALHVANAGLVLLSALALAQQHGPGSAAA